MKNIQSEAPATVSARKTYRPPTPIPILLSLSMASTVTDSVAWLYIRSKLIQSGSVQSGVHQPG
jgi:hypothetical protein